MLLAAAEAAAEAAAAAEAQAEVQEAAAVAAVVAARVERMVAEARRAVYPPHQHRPTHGSGHPRHGSLRPPETGS
jgi:hypothetical protein